MLKTASFAFLIAFSACGRNPGAQTRAFPGAERIQAALAAAQPKCVAFDAKRIGSASVAVGKEKFQNGRKGTFKLEAYQISRAIDRADRKIPNATLRISEFDDAASRAPRLGFEARCLDAKGEDQTLALSPATRIDSERGLILQAQPLKLAIGANGKMVAETEAPTSASQLLPFWKLPETVILLGASYQETFRSVSFRVQEIEDGSLRVKAEFVGVDPELSRVFVRVEAVYAWEAAK